MVLNALNKVNWMYVSFLHLITITDVLCFRINNISHNPMWIEAMWIIMQYFTDILRHKVQELKQYSIKRMLLIDVIFFQSLKMKSTPFLSRFSLRNVSIAVVKRPTYPSLFCMATSVVFFYGVHLVNQICSLGWTGIISQ